MERHLELLGWAVRDMVTGYEGVVEHVGQDLYGCVMAVVRSRATVDKEGKQNIDPGSWFDVARLERLQERVMEPIPAKGGEVVAGPAFTDKPVR